MIVFERYQLVRETPKGRWVSLVGSFSSETPVWRPKNSRDLAKTKAIALDKLLGRKLAHVRHARARSEDAALQLRSVKGMLESLKEWKKLES
jgi:hypothetical protein